MSRILSLSAVCLAVAGAVLVVPTSSLHASSLGIGVNEASLPSTGVFSGVLNWVNTQQQEFYRALTNALKSMRDSGDGVWALAGLSFLYGIFHAAGPGHGKAVISSYVLANEVALRRGVLLSFVSAMLQAVSAIVLMFTVFIILRGSAISMTDATHFLERASYAMIALFGGWLLWKKTAPRLAVLFGRGARTSLSSAHAPHHDHAHHHHHGDDHGACATCGHSHAPDPNLISAERFDLRTAWSAVVAVGLRPCSGALIVLTFSFLNGLWLGGILSVFAMALGTAITVATLAIIAVTAKNWAVAMAGDGRMGNRIHAAIEIAGAAFVFLLGLLLLGASLRA